MTILITGAAGQDGRLLAHKLLGEGLKVVGLCRPGKKEILTRYCPSIEVIEIDVSQEKTLLEVLNSVRPDEIFNLAGFSSVHQSWNNPSAVTKINSVVPAVLLKWCVESSPSTRLLQASSSEIFGTSKSSPQNELTPHNPITPYGLSKSFSHKLLLQFRDEYGLHASNAILYNHESPLRNETFVTRKITRAVAAISRGSKEPLRLGQVHSQRDWGWAPDYVDAMCRIIRQNSPGDFVVSTGIVHSVADVLKFAFEHVGVSDYSKFVTHDERDDRTVDPTNLVGDSAVALEQYGWAPTRNLREVIEEMVDFDLALIDQPESQWFAR